MATQPQPDLFAHAPQPVDHTPAPETIRARLHALLTTARKAQVMPWSAQEARVNRIIFPQMANWLPEPERDALRAAFAREMDRLEAATRAS